MNSPRTRPSHSGPYWSSPAARRRPPDAARSSVVARPRSAQLWRTPPNNATSAPAVSTSGAPAPLAVIGFVASTSTRATQLLLPPTGLPLIDHQESLGKESVDRFCDVSLDFISDSIELRSQ